MWDSPWILIRVRETFGENNVITIFVWDFLFSNGETLLAYLATFSGQLFFRRSKFFKLLYSNCFDTTVTLSEHLFLQSSCLFKELRFRKIHFLRPVILSEYLIFRSETSTEQPLLESREFLRQLLFGTATLLTEELPRIKISPKELAFSEELHLRKS